jgi:hypothetical protein
MSDKQQTDNTQSQTSFWKRWRKSFFICLIILIISGLCYVFPQPDYELWPPSEKNEKFKIYVTIDEYHSCINFPDYKLGLFQEWHMGAKEWYLSQDFKVSELALKAAKGKVDAVIRFGVFAIPYWEREGIPEKQVYTFWLTEKGFVRLNNFLHKHRGTDMQRKGKFWYFSYKQGYHLIQNCNSFTSSALIEAGLPIRNLLAQEGISFSWQLNRCKEIQSNFFHKYR